MYPHDRGFDEARKVEADPAAWADGPPRRPRSARALRDPVAVGTLRRPGAARLEFDAFQRWSPRAYDPESPVRIVAIDDESLRRLGQWPWPRTRVAELINNLSGAGAATIVLDVLFSEPERTPDGKESSGDKELADAIAKGRVVLGMAFADQGTRPTVKAGFATAGDDPRPFLPRLHRLHPAARRFPREGDGPWRHELHSGSRSRRP